MLRRIREDLHPMADLTADEHDDPDEGHYHPNQGGYEHERRGYEHEAGTIMLATHCFICTRPLRTPESIERGVGPICADRHGVFAVTGQQDPVALAAALETAPEKLRAAVTSKLEESGRSAAVSAAIHAAGNAWLHKTKDYALYVGAAMEIADALGYHGTAETLQRVVIEGKKFNEEGELISPGRPNGIVISDLGNGRWEIQLPFIQNKTVWWGVMGALKAVPGYRNANVGHNKYQASFPGDERTWLLILNALVGNLSGTLGVLPDGETFIVPMEQVPVPAPPGEAPDRPGAIDAAQQQPVQQLEPQGDVKVGDKIRLRDGREMIVGRVWNGRRIGYSPTGRGNFEWCGTNEVQTIETPPAAVAQIEEITGEAVPQAVKKRELPASMFDFQREAAMWLEQKGSGILALEQGLGKTLTSLSVADAPITVICRASLRTNWVDEVTSWRPDLTAVALGTEEEEDEDEKPKRGRGKGPKQLQWKKKADRPALIAEAMKADAVVVSHEVLKGEVLDALIARGCGTMIVDEAQEIKDLKVSWKRDKTGEWAASLTGSQRAKNAWQLAQIAKRRFMLSGTPLINGKPKELFPLLHMVDPREWKSFYKYAQRYCDPQETRWGTTYDGASNLVELNERIMGTYMLRMTKDQKLNLPPKTRNTLLVTLDTDIANQYREASENFLRWVQEHGGIEAAKRAERAEVIARLNALRRLSAIGKAATVAQDAYDFCQSGKPLVIMGHHKDALQIIVSALQEAGIKVGTFTGSDSDKDRQRAKRLFQTGLPLDAPAEQREYLQVLVCSIMSAGAGLTLTRASSMFFVERTWRPLDLVQAEDRIHRIGTTEPVTITYYDAAGSIDPWLAALLAAKLKVSGQVIDGATLTDTDAQDLVLGALFGEDMETYLEKIQMMRRNAGEYECDEYDDPDALPEWADPES